MPKYILTIEQIQEEIVEIEAETETQAFDRALEGTGFLIDSNLYFPTLVDSYELEGEQDDDWTERGETSDDPAVSEI